MTETYRRLVAELAPRVDLFLAETLSCASEARAALQAAGSAGKPCWLSLSLCDAHDATLRGGEAARDVLASLPTPPAALLFNCCAPQAVTAALRSLGAQGPELRTGGYANSFRQTTSSWLAGGEQQLASITCGAEHDAEGNITPEAYRAHAAQWVEAGATVLGGCCGVGPEHIRRLADLPDPES
jgi:S-methylmethionine-dependent homocysteine/selenocysteine methylase